MVALKICGSIYFVEETVTKGLTTSQSFCSVCQ